MTDLTDIEKKNYPNVGQSFGIAGILIAGMIIMSPLTIILNKFIGKDASMLINYLFAMGIPFWIVYTIKKRKTGSVKFNFRIENKRIIPFVIISTIALLFGIMYPLAELINYDINSHARDVKRSFCDESQSYNIFDDSCFCSHFRGIDISRNYTGWTIE